MKLLKSYSLKLTILLLFFFKANILNAGPDLGQAERSVLSPKTEQLVGQAMLMALNKNQEINDDPTINSYLTNLGNRLVNAANIQNRKFNFFCIDKDEINAYAFFGDNIVIYSKLILNSSSENELAAVMAHEISHAKQYHLLRRIAQNKNLLPVTLAEAVGAVVIGSPELMLAALMHHQQQILNYSRAHEQEADQIGIQILYNAGFNPHAMPNAFQDLSNADKFHIDVPEYLLTHPVYDTRISDAKNRADQFPYRQNSTNHNYYLIKSKIKLQLTSDKHLLLKNIKNQLDNGRYTNKIATEYLYALCLASLNKNQQAEILLEKLSKQNPDDYIITISLANLEQLNKPQKALSRLEKLLTIYPEEPAVLLTLTEHLLKTNKLIQAKNTINKHNELDNSNPKSFELLAQIEYKLKNLALMHIAKSKINLLTGDLKDALLQLELAKKQTQDKSLIHKIEEEKNYIEDLKVQLEKL